MNKNTLEIVLLKGEEILKEAGILEAKLDAWYLLEYYFHITRSEFFLNPRKEINPSMTKEYLSLIQKRADRIPLQYITGEQEFMGLTYKVTPDVLIPRQDTETLVEEVMKVANHKKVLDLCTGSGCIIISLSVLCNLEKALGTDISKEALAIAKENASNHQAEAIFLEGNLLESVTESFDIIVSNPPYIPTTDIDGLMTEVREHEPILALDGREDGLYFYRKIVKEAPNYLNPGGMLFLEIGYNQGEALMNLLGESGYEDIRLIKDLAGHNRVVYGRIQ